MNVGSLFSGVGGFDLGLERAGHTIVFQCEKDEYRRRVLERHWPGVPCFAEVADLDGRSRLPDLRKRNGNASQRPKRLGQGRVDLLCGGFPCQDLSVAGRRAGLAGERSGLFFEFARIADALLTDGGWLLIENVPGLLSSNGGRDFAVLLATLAELGFHDLAWRVLDSRYLGVPQRRRRVFILARRSGGRCASEVLLEPESGGGDFEAGRASREVAARSVGEGFANPLGAKQGFRQDLDHDTYVAGVAAPLTKGFAAGDGVSYPGRRKEDDENLVAGPVTKRYGKGINTTADDGAAVVSPSPHPNGDGAPARVPGRVDGAVTNTIARGYADRGVDVEAQHVVQGGQSTDRCGRDPKPDGPRYAACGDAVTVNVAHWIGLRLTQVEE